MHRLIPFHPLTTSEISSVQAGLVLRNGNLQIQFVVLGTIAELLLPQPEGTAQFRDGLWQTTCLEVFLQSKGERAYEEWNLSPNGNWAYYKFSDYRQLIAEVTRREPVNLPLFSASEQQLTLTATLPYQVDQGSERDNGFVYGLTAILQLRSGAKQYWAMRHEADHPDFHQAASFIGLQKPAQRFRG